MSKRKYTVVGFDNSIHFTYLLSFEELVDNKINNYEFIYTLQEDLDSILDLKVGQRIWELFVGWLNSFFAKQTEKLSTQTPKRNDLSH